MPGLNCKLARALMHLYPFPRGQGRIVDRTFLSRLPFEEETLQIMTRDGFMLRVFPNDLIGVLESLLTVLKCQLGGGHVMDDFVARPLGRGQNPETHANA